MSDTLRQIAQNIWMFPHDKDQKKIQPAVGIICTPTQTILVDGGNSPKHARRILAALKTIDAPPISRIIYTHHHWDHVFGACAFGAPTIGHELCRDLLLQSAARPWSHDYIQREIRRNPRQKLSYGAMDRAIDSWRDFRIVIPSTTFSQRLLLHLDGLTVELAHVGGWHAADSIVVRVKEARVMFLGDCFYPRLPQDNAGRAGVAWSMLASLLDKSIDLYVHGYAFPLKRSVLLFWAVRLLARVRG